MEFKLKKELKNIAFYNVKSAPFDLYGFHNPYESVFKRIPADVANNVNKGVMRLHKNTSGGRVRFKTDSPYIAIKVVMPEVIRRFPNMSLSGTSGFDMYTPYKGIYRHAGTFTPPPDMTGGYEAVLHFDKGGLHDVLIHFPTYNDVDELYIGIDKHHELYEGSKYRSILPTVYYGSSITQGGEASHAGNSYPAIVSRNLNIDFLCLGFSGHAFGEDAIANYISELPMSAFVMDYDHNSEFCELRERHNEFFKIIRSKNPALPIVLMTRPDFKYNCAEHAKRRSVIKMTYQTAVDNGDKNVYFIDGSKVFPVELRSYASTDVCHPNDFGFYLMSKAVSKVLNKIYDI